MPIQQIQSRSRVPILGKIRLGERTEAGYPTNVPYFNLDDVPEVEKVYGKNPSAIDIMFPGDDIEAVIPTWYRWFAQGKKDATGKVIGGKRICQGNGPDDAGAPGVATWFDRNKKPSADEILETDAAGFVTKRVCHGANCIDARDEKGNPKCKAGMQVFVVLPRVGFHGVYEIDTTSWFTIKSFHDQLRWMLALPGGSFRWHPLKVVKIQKVMTFWDHKANVEKTSTQHVVELQPNMLFLEAHGAEMKTKIAQLQASSQVLLPAPEEIEATTMEDNYPTIDTAGQDAQEVTAAKVATAEAVVDDPDVTAAFDEFAKVVFGKPMTRKDRLIKVRQKESDLPAGTQLKDAVLLAIKLGIEAKQGQAAAQQAQAPKPAPAAQQPRTAPPPQQPPPPQAVVGNPATPQPDADGII